MITAYATHIEINYENDSGGKWASGECYDIVISDKLDLTEATESLAEHMQMLADHPNIDPMALQGALMGALMQGGD